MYSRFMGNTDLKICKNSEIVLVDIDYSYVRVNITLYRQSTRVHYTALLLRNSFEFLEKEI
jgi:hypothetical protein